DNAKNVDGRKRHIVVDSMGLLLAVLVTAANVDDAKAAAELFKRLEGQPLGRMTRMFADTKYHNFALYEWVQDNARWDLCIVRRPDDAEGWVKLPIRWTVERTFAWLGKCRRLSKDRERSVRSSEAFVKLAMIHLMLHFPRKPNRSSPNGEGRNGDCMSWFHANWGFQAATSSRRWDSARKSPLVGRPAKAVSISPCKTSFCNALRLSACEGRRGSLSHGLTLRSTRSAASADQAHASTMLYIHRFTLNAPMQA